GPARLLLVVLALPAAQRLAGDVLYFTPAHLPDVAPLYSGEKVLLAASGYPPHPDYRLFPARPEREETSQWVREVDDGQSRFLVEDPALGERPTGRPTPRSSAASATATSPTAWPTSTAATSSASPATTSCAGTSRPTPCAG